MPLSALMGGKKGDAQFGQTQFGGGDGSYVDVTLRTSRNPSLTEALQAVPEGTKLAPTLQLKVLRRPSPSARPAKTRSRKRPSSRRARSSSTGAAVPPCARASPRCWTCRPGRSARWPTSSRAAVQRSGRPFGTGPAGVAESR